MSNLPEYLSADCTIREAARHMNDMNCGFAPLAENDKLVGIVTDRDIAIRAFADGVSPDDKVSTIETPKVLYCCEDDDVEAVLSNMEEQQVQRLIVLNSKESKDFVGVVSLADIADHAKNDQALCQHIVNCCRHYH
jgi:predicted transcriptional regulator